MLGMTREQILQAAAQKMQANQDITTAMAEIIAENNKLIEKQVEDLIETRARARSFPADLV